MLRHVRTQLHIARPRILTLFPKITQYHEHKIFTKIG
jgi:hypothetical protein